MARLLALVLGAVTVPLMSQAWVPSPLILWLVAGIAILPRLYPLRFAARQYCVRVGVVVSLFCIGAALALAGVNNRVDQLLDERWHGRDIRLEGIVQATVDESAHMQRFHMRVVDAQPIELQPVLKDRLVRLSWYYGDRLRTGEHWQMTVRLKRPRGFVNPRGFDYSAWLLTHDLVATGYVRSAQVSVTTADRAGVLNHWREVLPQRLFASSIASSGFFQALLLGDKSDITAQQWRVLQRTGTIHLMAISGLHVGLVAGLGFLCGWLLVRGLNAWLPVWLSGRLPRLFPPMVSVSTAFLYSALAGFSIPTQRAMILVALTNLALAVGLRMRPLHLLACAGVIVVLSSPLAPTQNGFWLSFGAVVVLILGFAGRRRLTGAVALLKAQGLLAIGLLGPLLALGQTVSLAGPLANLLAVPVVSLIIVPGLLLSALLSGMLPGFAALLIEMLDRVYAALWLCLTLLSDAQWAQWWPAFPTTAALVLLVGLASVLVLLPGGLQLRLLGLVLAGFALLAPRPAPPPLSVAVIEVGQGLAVWVQTRGGSLLYDAGPQFSAEFDAGSRIITPLLQSQGIKRLDSVIVSHGDNDHSGGLAGILDNLTVGQLLVGDPSLKEQFPSAEVCQQGNQWQWDEVRFTVLWPEAGLERERLASNNRSCVVLVEWREQRVLLAGDIDSRIERYLLKENRIPRDLALLIAPHHGSNTSSSLALVSHTRPRAVVFSAGYENRYGHPHGAVVDRYVKAGSGIYNTAEQGAIIFSWAEEGPPRIAKTRERLNRAWF